MNLPLPVNRDVNLGAAFTLHNSSTGFARLVHSIRFLIAQGNSLQRVDQRLPPRKTSKKWLQNSAKSGLFSQGSGEPNCAKKTLPMHNLAAPLGQTYTKNALELIAHLCVTLIGFAENNANAAQVLLGTAARGHE